MTAIPLSRDLEPPPAENKDCYILIVDDEEPNRTLLRDPLEAQGYEVAEAENGAQAIEMALRRAPDIVLLDVMMPQMDGFHCCRLLKGHPRTAPSPVLMVTALSERQERLLGIEAGANDFLTKPVDFQDLLLRVRNAATVKSLHDQLAFEKRKSDQILHSVLPLHVVERMKKGELNIVDSYRNVTVLFADLVGFTRLVAHIDPQQVVSFLNEIFSHWDCLAEKHGLERIKTIGDAYMVAGGMNPTGPDPLHGMLEFALEAKRFLGDFNQQYRMSIQTRVGVSTGPLIAGVIGHSRYAYDLWGETVNLAHCMESLASPDQVQVDEATFLRAKDHFQFEQKWLEDTKGRGRLCAYVLTGPRHSN